MKPFFSVVIPLYNKENYIKETIESVINQTFKDFEIIVVNDGSTDKSYDIVNSIKATNIRLFSNNNKGLSFSRNFGIKQASANYIAFLDADDLWMEDYLKTIHELIIRNKGQKIFATNVKVLKPKQLFSLSAKPFKKNNVKIIKSYFNLNKNIITPSSLVINKSIFNVTGYFDETINYGEEYDFYIRCFSIYKLVYYNESKTYYRIGVPNQLTTPNKNFNRIIPDYEKYKKQFNSPFLKKFLDFIHYELMILYKMEKNKNQVNFYKKKIEPLNLSFIQKIKYYLPIELFYFLKKIYVWISRMSIRF